MSRWERACDGEGQVALIIGEAGIGKSRLVHRFHEAIAGTPHTWIEAGAGAFFQNTPFYPVTEMLRQFLGNSPAEDQITQLERRLIAAGLVERIVWFIAPVLFAAPGAVPVLAGADLGAIANGWTFDEVERMGNDLMITARLPHV